MRRAAISIPANIAEGATRNHTKEYLQFLHIALGSCAELETLLIIAEKRNYFSKELFASLCETLNHEMRMLVSLIKSLKT
jgi:four helix bundle protein